MSVDETLMCSFQVRSSSTDEKLDVSSRLVDVWAISVKEIGDPSGERHIATVL